MIGFDELLQDVDEARKLYAVFKKTRVPDSAAEAREEKWELKVERSEYEGKPYDREQQKADAKILIPRRVALGVLIEYERQLVDIMAKGKWIDIGKIDRINTEYRLAIDALKGILASAVAALSSLSLGLVRRWIALLIKSFIDVETSPSDLFDPLYWSNKSDQVFALESATAREVARDWQLVKSDAAKILELAKKASVDWAISTVKTVLNIYDSAAALHSTLVIFQLRDAAIRGAEKKKFKTPKHDKRWTRRKRARR